MQDKIDQLLDQDCETHGENLEKAVTDANHDGLFLEFGVASGHTITRIASCHDGKVYGFDSFKGLPEDWRDGIGKGAFAQDNLPVVPDNVELIVGLFQDTLDDFLSTHPGNIGFVHLDADLYSSTSYVLNKLKDRFVDGSILMFDEFAHYPGYKEHEYKALIEFLEQTGFDVELVSKWHGESYTFKLVRK